MSLAASAWAFGWEALVAVGTLVLAAGTAYLAWNTHSLARQTAADVQAQWRPVLVPVADRPPELSVYMNDQASLTATIWNSGRGPALFVRAQHDPSNNSPQNWSLGALSPNERVQLVFRGNVGGTGQILLDYRDLAGRTYSTAIIVDFLEQAGKGRYYDVRFGEGEQFTTHGAAVPQAGLREVGWPRR